MTSDRPIRIASVIPSTTAEGPGRRFAVWVQGCTIRCDGCFNPHMWTPDGGTSIAPEALAARASEAAVDGVTLLGGEPFEQAEPLTHFASLVQRQGLSVMAFTGHLLEDLKADSQPGATALLTHVDLLIDGPYVADQKDTQRPWAGSTNQRFHFLSDRYRHIEQDLATVPDRVELRIAPTGDVTVNGWATVDQLDDLLADSTSPVGRGKVR